jgi:hypothetical protein
VTDDMPQASGSDSKKTGFAFAHLAFVIAFVTPLFLLLCMMATHLGFISNDLGFKTLTLGIAPRMAMGAIGIGCLSLLISIFMAPRRCGPWALAALAISAGLLGGYYYYHKALKNDPPIWDVATNWERPLSFSDKLIAARGKEAAMVEDYPRVPRNESLDWGGRSVADINGETCPAAKTITHKIITEAQSAAIADMLRASHYTVFGVSPWRIEATYQDNFYGFKSDIVIRIDPESVDVRSVSRYGMPDLGANCRRVTDIVNKIKAM